MFLPPVKCRPGSPTRAAAQTRDRRAPLPRWRCILDSLALAYRRTVRQAQELCGTAVDVVDVVGAGAQNALLRQLTADACRLPVIAGPVEATALGKRAWCRRVHSRRWAVITAP